MVLTVLLSLPLGHRRRCMGRLIFVPDKFSTDFRHIHRLLALQGRREVRRSPHRFRAAGLIPLVGILQLQHRLNKMDGIYTRRMPVHAIQIIMFCSEASLRENVASSFLSTIHSADAASGLKSCWIRST